MGTEPAILFPESSDEEWELLSIPYSIFDVLLSDVDHGDLVRIGRSIGKPYLAECPFVTPPFPVSGTIFGRHRRFIVPLTLQRAGKPNTKLIRVLFIADSGSPYTTMSVQCLQILFGDIVKEEYDVWIQDRTTTMQCEVSQGHFEQVNLLGTDAMESLDLSCLVKWEQKTWLLIEHK